MLHLFVAFFGQFDAMVGNHLMNLAILVPFTLCMANNHQQSRFHHVGCWMCLYEGVLRVALLSYLAGGLKKRSLQAALDLTQDYSFFFPNTTSPQHHQNDTTLVSAIDSPHLRDHNDTTLTSSRHHLTRPPQCQKTYPKASQPQSPPAPTAPPRNAQ